MGSMRCRNGKRSAPVGGSALWRLAPERRRSSEEAQLLAAFVGCWLSKVPCCLVVVMFFGWCFWDFLRDVERSGVLFGWCWSWDRLDNLR